MLPEGFRRRARGPCVYVARAELGPREREELAWRRLCGWAWDDIYICFSDPGPALEAECAEPAGPFAEAITRAAALDALSRAAEAAREAALSLPSDAGRAREVAEALSALLRSGAADLAAAYAGGAALGDLAAAAFSLRASLSLLQSSSTRAPPA